MSANLKIFLNIGLPLNKDGTRIIRWNTPIDKVSKESLASKKEFERWGYEQSQQDKAIKLHHVRLTWRDIDIPSLPQIHLLQYQCIREYMEVDAVYGFITLFTDHLSELYDVLDQEFGSEKSANIEKFYEEGKFTKHMKLWYINDKMLISEAYSNCVYLTVKP